MKIIFIKHGIVIFILPYKMQRIELKQLLVDYFLLGKYLANDGKDKIGQYWIKLEKTIINVLASQFFYLLFLLNLAY